MKIITGGVTAAKGFQGSIYSCRNQISGKNRYGNGLQRETMCGSRNFYY